MSHDRDFNVLLDRLFVSDPNDPQVVKYLQRDKCEVAVQTDPQAEQGIPREQVNDVIE